MTDLPNGSLSVDPEGVSRLGDAYAAQLAAYERHLQQLEDIRSRYAPAWGDDDMGKQFKKQFDAVSDTLQGLITSVKKSLDYTSTGLQLNGKAYAEAEENALKAGHLLLNGLNQLKAPAASPRTEAVRVLSDGDDGMQTFYRIKNRPQKFYRLLNPSDKLTPALEYPLRHARHAYYNGAEGHGEYHPGIPPVGEFRVLSDGSDDVRILSDASGQDQPRGYRRLLSHGEHDPAPEWVQQPSGQLPLTKAHVAEPMREPMVRCHAIQAPLATEYVADQEPLVTARTEYAGDAEQPVPLRPAHLVVEVQDTDAPDKPVPDRPYEPTEFPRT